MTTSFQGVMTTYYPWKETKNNSLTRGVYWSRKPPGKTSQQMEASDTWCERAKRQPSSTHGAFSETTKSRGPGGPQAATW